MHQTLVFFWDGNYSGPLCLEHNPAAVWHAEDACVRSSVFYAPHQAKSSSGSEARESYSKLLILKDKFWSTLLGKRINYFSGLSIETDITKIWRVTKDYGT